VRKLIFKNFLILCLILSSQAFADESEQQLKDLFNIFNAQNTRIKTKGCDFQEKKWLKLLTTSESFTGNVTFNDKCDIQGEYKPKMFEYFPFAFKVQNHPKIDKVKGTVKLTIQFNLVTILRIQFSQTEVIGKNNAVFNADYKLEVDPFNPKKFIKRPLGGELELLKLNGKPANRTIQLPAN
tara:strand:- start:4996 stop:5541 length:546 start_codon:yes stop_codon:yes gene_type:complete